MKYYHFLISLSGSVLLVILDLLLAKDAFAVWYIAVDLLFANAAMIFCPYLHEKVSNFPAFTSILLALCAAATLLRIKELIPLLVFGSLAVNLYLTLRRKFSKVRNLFKSDEVWNNVLDFSNIFIAFLLALPSLLLSFGTAASVAAILFQSALLIASYMLKKQNLSFMMNGRNMKMIKSIANSNLRDPHDCDESAENRRMNALYKSAVDYMEKNQPFLDENFNLEDFARRLYTNKVYLSRTVNTLSGRNFRQFVNYYRVKYSTELFRQDPRLKVEELAMMSGFHTVVSYNMAFHLFMNETPSEWMRRYRSSLI